MNNIVCPLCYRQTSKHFCFIFPNTIENYATIKNYDKIQSCETLRKKYIILSISTYNHHSQSIDTTSSSILNLNTIRILSTVGKYCMCFMKEGKSDQAARFIKSRKTNKAIDSVLSIDTFEPQCFMLKCML